jgi:FkbM family methyltransferase
VSGEGQRVGLTLYRWVNRLGLMSSRPAQRFFTRSYFAYKRHIEDPFHNLAVRYPELFMGGHVLDVGANIGYTATVFAGALDPQFRVWAFEPSEENFRRLEATVADRGLADRIVASRAAVGDHHGTADLGINEFHPGDHRVVDANSPQPDARRVEYVPLTTIDEEVRARSIAPVTFIKVDVQGYEMHVCRGMTATLDANPSATIVVEYAPDMLIGYGVAPRELLRFFEVRGYRAYRLTQRGGLDAVDLNQYADCVPAPGYVDLLFTRRPIEGQI